MLFILLVMSSNVNAGDVDNSVILERIDSLSKRMDDKFDAVNDKFDAIGKQINELSNRIDRANDRIDVVRTEMNQRFDDFNYRMLMFFIAIIAIILWDRRTALKPIHDQFRAFKERIDFLWDSYYSDKEGLQKFKPV